MLKVKRLMAPLLRAAVSRLGLTHRLYLRIYFALLISLGVAALLFGFVAHRHSDSLGPTLEDFAELAAQLLPPKEPRAGQQAVLFKWQQVFHANLALYTPDGVLIGAAGRQLPAWQPGMRNSAWLGGFPPIIALKLPDGRWLMGQRIAPYRAPLGLITALSLVALAVAIAAYPVVRRLTRRLERLQASVETWGGGQLSTRVAVEGQDEIASLANSFNLSAARIEALLGAQKNLLANASHELRSPLTRIRMAVELMEGDAQPALREELNNNIRELDQLVDEILLTSRLDAISEKDDNLESIDLTALLAEECARVDARLSFDPVSMQGEAKLIRRMVRNLLENAKRYGGGTRIEASVAQASDNAIVLEICDSGPGVPELEREHIFAPFYRLRGAREREGGVGLGLSLVRQIARRHGGDVTCLGREGGGSCFLVNLPVSRMG